MYDTIQVNRRRSFCDFRRVVMVILCVVAFAVIVGLSVGLANQKRQDKDRSAAIENVAVDAKAITMSLDPEEDPRCQDLDPENGVNQNPIFHCACFGEMGTIDSNMIHSATDIAVAFPDDDVFLQLTPDASTMKCDKNPRFQVFWWLAWFQMETTAFTVEEKPLAADYIMEFMFLGEFFLATGGVAGWTISDNWMSSKSVCMWFGINCRNGNQHVDAIVLRHNGLKGTLPASIHQAPALREVVLHSNDVGKEIPETLWGVKGMEILDLGNNIFTGTLSGQVGLLNETLISLDLRSNYLTGEIPTGVTECTGLHLLKLEDNEFEGTIPYSFGQLTGLMKLSLATNYDITGTLPESFGQMTELRELSLHDMDLSGTIPKAMVNAYTMTNLEHIRIDNNYFSGTLPTTIASAWPLLTFMDVRKNEFTGTIPTEMGRMEMLELASFSENLFIGTIPTEFGQLAKMQHLHISFTDVTGFMPAEVCALRQEIEDPTAAAQGLQTLVADCGYLACACCNIELSDDECQREDDDYSAAEEEEGEGEEEQPAQGEEEEEPQG